MANTSLLGSFGDVSGSGLMFRNKIINGGFDIWQRGTSQTSSGYGSDDRWMNENIGSSKTHSQQSFALGQTDVPGNPKYFSRTVVTSVAGSGNFCGKRQRIEGAKTLSGQMATLSFWAKADAAKNIAVEFLQNYGSGGAPSSGVGNIGVTTFSLTASWKYFTTTVFIPSISGKTLGTNNDDCLEVLFFFDAGSSFNSRTNSLGQQSGTFDMANVQLEAGASATPFEQRPIGTELSLCQRYYEVIVSPVGSIDLGIPVVYQGSTSAEMHVWFKAGKRGTVILETPGTSAVFGRIVLRDNAFNLHIRDVTAVGLSGQNPNNATIALTTGFVSGCVFNTFDQGNSSDRIIAVSSEL